MRHIEKGMMILIKLACYLFKKRVSTLYSVHMHTYNNFKRSSRVRIFLTPKKIISWKIDFRYQITILRAVL